MSADRDLAYRRHRFPPEDHKPRHLALFPVPFCLRMVEEMLAVRRICVGYETMRQWAMKFGGAFSD